MFKQSKIFVSITSLAMLVSVNAFAAKPVDLSEQQPSALRAFMANTQFAAGPQSDLKTKQTSVDLNGVSHTRFQQVYAGIEVFGADGILHAKHNKANSLRAMASGSAQAVKMDGVVYADLAQDLGPIPKAASKEKASIAAKQYYQATTKDTRELSVRSIKPVVYIDKTVAENPKARFAYEVVLNVTPTEQDTRLTRPIYIIDAENAKVYEESNGIHTIGDVYVGGVGGNPKMGKIVYGATAKEVPNAVRYLPKLRITRFSDDRVNFCLAENVQTVVKDFRDGGDEIGDIIKPGNTVNFNCQVKDPFNLGIFWNETWSKEHDLANEGYSPANDALYAGEVVNKMYKEWYGVPVLKHDDESEMQLLMLVHYPDANAYWDGEKMIFGDGVSQNPITGVKRNMFYPLTSLDVGAHEVSHGFTSQHADLYYAGQSGGINEAFSDMAAQAAEFYSENKSSWNIGYKITRELINNGGPLRYMDHPEKDGHSIAHAKDYYFGLNVHYSSGVFNRMFYLIATDNEKSRTGSKRAVGWDTKKAFDVMVEANRNYWTRTASFEEAACGVLKATRAYAERYPGDYKVDTVMKAMKSVGVMDSPRKVAACLAGTIVK